MGFAVDAQTGAITGTPQKVRDGYVMRLRAVDADSMQTTVANWTFDVNETGVFAINPVSERAVPTMWVPFLISSVMPFSFTPGAADPHGACVLGAAKRCPEFERPPLTGIGCLAWQAAGWTEANRRLASKYHVGETHLLERPRQSTRELLQVRPAHVVWRAVSGKWVSFASLRRAFGGPTCGIHFATLSKCPHAAYCTRGDADGISILC